MVCFQFDGATMLWTIKYAPKTLEEIVGNSEIKGKVKVWALEWSRGNRKPPLLITGPPGVGKTTIAYALAESNGWELLELNATDSRNKKSIEKALGAASTTTTLSGAMKLIFIDEVDSAVERGGVSAVYEVAKNALQPIIIVANEPWNPSMSSLRTSCTLLEMRKINVRSIGARLKGIAETEKLDMTPEDIEGIAHNSKGDMRSAINDLQSLIKETVHCGERDRKQDIFQSIRTVLKTMDYSEARNATRNLDVDFDMYSRWIDENIPREYEKPEDIASALDSLSRADVFQGRIRRRQYWGLFKYCIDFTTAGVALAKEERYHKFTKYSFPQVIKKLSSTKSKRANEKKLLKRIGTACHVSTRRARIYLPLLKLMFKKSKNPEKLEAYFRFDKDDMKYFGNRKKS